MERVEGLMKNLKLSAAEQKGFGKSMMLGGSEVVKKEVQALGKVLSEKPVYAEGIAASLGRVWCPLKEFAVRHCQGMSSCSLFCRSRGKERRYLMAHGW
jgi:hypothetical protein